MAPPSWAPLFALQAPPFPLRRIPLRPSAPTTGLPERVPELWAKPDLFGTGPIHHPETGGVGTRGTRYG